MSDEQHVFKTGTIKWFDDYKRIGFILPDAGGADVMFHVSALRVMRSIEILPNDGVRYREFPADRGGMRAIVVELTTPMDCCPACGRAK